LAHFAVTEASGSGWDPTRSRREQDGWDEHAAFMDALLDDGFVVLGGPIGDGERVLVVVEAESEQEVEARLAEDPWLRDGTLRVDKVEPWSIWLDGRPAPPDDLTRILGLVFGNARAKSLYVAAKLGLADELAGGPLPVDELARRTDSNEDALHRVMRQLAREGLFAEVEPGTFAVTDLGRLMSEDAPGSRKYLSLMFAEQTDRVFDHLLEVVRTGEPAAKHAFGKPYWDWLSDHPGAAEIFNKAMASGATHRLASLLPLGIWSKAGTVVDVGGGNGTAIAALLKAHPHLRGTVFDLLHAQPEAMRLLETEGVADRAAFVPGSFFEAVPGGADVYVLFQVLHNWNDEDGRRILRTIRGAIPAAGQLVVVEDFALADDPALLALVLLGGRERTAEGWTNLLAAGGFEVTRITPGPRASAIEARPA
jgi:uncharacterized protein YciI/SAM-dependent methyltransferase